MRFAVAHFLPLTIALAANWAAWGAEHHGVVKFGGLPVPGAAVTATQGDKRFSRITSHEGWRVLIPYRHDPGNPIAVGIANAPPSLAQSAAGAQTAQPAPSAAGASKAFSSLIVGSTKAQTNTSPTFEVASVRRTDQCGVGRSIDSGSVALRGVPLKPVLMEAFKVKMERIEGPSWLETDCFDISAKIPDGESLDQLSAMLQALLTERFKLVAHKEDRPSSGYALVVDKGGPKFKEDDANGNFMRSKDGKMLYAYGMLGHGALKGVMTMATLASNLSTKGYGPVQDLTGLTGKYDIDLSWAPDPAFGPTGVGATGPAATPPGADIPAPEGSSLFTALRESLGLKLERRNVQVQFVVIDHIERIPTEN